MLGLPILLCGVGLLVALTMVTCSAARRHPGDSHGATAGCIRSMDAYSLLRDVPEGGAPVKQSTLLGGYLSIVALSLILLLSAYLVVQWQSSNVLTQQSLAVLSDGTWGAVAGLPWAAASSVSGGAPIASVLRFQITASGEPGACGAPISWAASGGGAWVLEPATTTAGGGGCTAQSVPVEQFAFSCADCELSADSKLQLLLHYSCQSIVLEAATTAAWPLGATSVLRAPAALTLALPGSLLTSVSWTVVPLLSVLLDNTTSGGGQGASMRGYQLVRSTLSALQAPLSSSGSSALVLPLSASVVVTLVLPLQPVYAVTLLTQRMPWTQVLANIVGFSGVLSLFGSVYRVADKARKRTKGCTLCRGTRAGKGRGGGGPLQSRGDADSMGDARFTTLNPLRQQVEQIYVRHTDGADVWFSSRAGGETLWEVPKGGVIVEEENDKEEVGNEGIWDVHTDGEDTWYSHRATGEVVWDLPLAEGAGGGEAEGGGDGERWTRHTDASGDVWFSRGQEVLWDLPAGAVVEGGSM